MKYFNLLTKEEILEIVNKCISAENFAKSYRVLDEADYIEVEGQEDRVDLNNNRYFWVQAWNTGRLISKYIASYEFYDFDVTLSGQSSEVLNGALRLFMAKRFGKDYVEDLFNYHLAKAQAESDILMSQINQTRE